MIPYLRRKLKPFFHKDIVDYVHYRYNLDFFKKNSKSKKQMIESYSKKYPDTEYISNNIKSPSVVFDIGAHYGEMSFFFSKLFGNSTIYSFEPTNRSFKYFLKVIKKLKLRNVVPKNLALGERKGVSYLNTSGDSAMNNISKTGEKIIIDTVDDFVERNKIKNIDFIKCDVEGFEYFVFKGGLNSIRKFKPIIFSEIQKEWYSRYSKQSALDLLIGEGYIAYRYDNKLKKLIEVSEVSEEYGDYFFFPKKK